MKVWNAWNTVPTVQSTKGNKFLQDTVEVGLSETSYTIHVYDTPLGVKWLEALKDNLRKKRLLEKNFCFLGFADSKRDLNYLIKELNKSITQINSFDFSPEYEHIHPFVANDFQYSAKLGVGRDSEGDFPGLKLKHEACNQLHRYFEDLQGTSWELSPYYKQADRDTKYAIRQLNNICHEIESWVSSYRKSIVNPEWMRSAQITTFLNAPRLKLDDNDMEQFKSNRYKRELGGVYLHWSQVGKTLYEVFRDEGAVELNDATCSTINHQRYYSGEFDVEWGQDIDEDVYDWKKKEMDDYKQWLSINKYDWEDPKLALGYAKIGQIDLAKTFGDSSSFLEIHKEMTDNLDIKYIKVLSNVITEQHYPYNLDSGDWSEMQKKALDPGYKHNSNNDGN